MGRSLIISDKLYKKLEATARQRGLSSVEQLIEEWQTREASLCQRREVVLGIDALREKLQEVHGTMPDSVPLIREDRERP
jgi:hypothetical protein